MQARWIEEWDGPLLAGERPDPQAGEGEVLVEVEACGVGLTVLNCMRGDLGKDPELLPRIPGHELIGTVAAVGPGVDEGLVGRRVMAYFYLSCGRCTRCVAGQESLCLDLRGWVGVHSDGGYSERAVLPARNAIPLDGDVDPVLATAIPDAIATPVHVARRARIRVGERVAVIAAGGGVGVHMVQVARAHGARVVGLEAHSAKLAFLDTELGVSGADSSDFGAVLLPKAFAGRGVDVVVDLLGTRASLAWSIGALAHGGRLVVLTTFPRQALDVEPRELVMRELSILASRYASRSELELAARLVTDGTVRPVVGEVVGLDGVDELHESLRAGRVTGRGALSWRAA